MEADGHQPLHAHHQEIRCRSRQRGGRGRQGVARQGPGVVLEGRHQIHHRRDAAQQQGFQPSVADAVHDAGLPAVPPFQQKAEPRQPPGLLKDAGGQDAVEHVGPGVGHDEAVGPQEQQVRDLLQHQGEQEKHGRPHHGPPPGRPGPFSPQKQQHDRRPNDQYHAEYHGADLQARKHRNYLPPFQDSTSVNHPAGGMSRENPKKHPGCQPSGMFFSNPFCTNSLRAKHLCPPKRLPRRAGERGVSKPLCRRRRRGGFVSRGDEIPPGVRLSPTTPTASE